MHMTRQIDHLGKKKSAVLRVSTDIFGVSKDIDGKMLIFRVNLGMWNLQSIILKKWALFCRVSAHIYEVFQEIDGIMFILRVNLTMWPSNQSSWKNEHCFEGFNTHLWGFDKIDRKTSIFQVNLGMWTLQLIVSEKWALFWGFQHPFMRFLRK